MSMLRNQFASLNINKIKALIIANLDFIQTVAPFKETPSMILAIKELVDEESNIVNLRATLLNLMQIVLYWDNHQAKNGLLNPVQKNIFFGMLDSAIINFNNNSPETIVNSYLNK